MWRVAELSGKAERALARLKRTPEKMRAVFNALAQIEEHPKADPDKPWAIRHMKGDWRCHREFRDLPDEMRVIYWVDDAARQIEVKYIGPHL